MRPNNSVHRFGISTNALKNLKLNEAIDTIHAHGFNAMEINPHLYGGPAYFDQADRRDLRKRLSCFDTVTVHPSAATYRGGNTGKQVRWKRNAFADGWCNLQILADPGCHV